MPTHASMMETSRHTKKTLYVVAAFYVAVGFVAATASALNGDRLGTFLGFLIISGALAATALLRAVLRIGVRISAIGEAMEGLHARLNRVEAGLRVVREHVGVDGRAATTAGGIRVLDLAAIGSGDPSVLSAATLDRQAYPRLVTTMEEAPPAQSAAAEAAEHTFTPLHPTLTPSDERTLDAMGTQSETNAQPNDFEDACDDAEVGGAATKNLLRQWKVALRDGDLAGCRAVYSALIDTAGTEAAASLGAQVEELADRIERSFREAFSLRVRERDYAGALAIGERMCSLLPDRAVVAEFLRVRAHLLRRLNREAAPPDEPLAAAR
jgi:hypothetical protein